MYSLHSYKTLFWFQLINIYDRQFGTIQTAKKIDMLQSLLTGPSRRIRSAIGRRPLRWGHIVSLGVEHPRVIDGP